jgi:membrane protein YqaA with SNARE-associated domain
MVKGIMFDWFMEWFLEISRQVVTMPVTLAAPLMVVIGTLDSSLLSLPEVNDYITVARIANNPREVYYFPLFPALGSVFGCLILYHIARRGEGFVAKRFHPRHLERVKAIYHRWGLVALIIPALLPPPMPFKIFVVTAGVLGYPVARFAVVIMLARTTRYYFWGVLAWFFRDEVRQMIDWLGQHVVSILGGLILLLLLVLTSRWLIIRRKQRSSSPAQTDTIPD